MHDRERIMSQIESAALELRKQGAVESWVAGADPCVRLVCVCIIGYGLLCNFAALKVSVDVHGPLLELLASQCKFPDKGCIELFRQGGQLHGMLSNAGLGVPTTAGEGCRSDDLVIDMEKRNSRVLVCCVVVAPQFFVRVSF